MKNFIFRKDWHGFEDRTKSINKMRYLISAHKKGITAYTNEEYTETTWQYVNYLVFAKGLTEEQKEYIRTKEKGHIPKFGKLTDKDVDQIYERWLEVVANFKLNRLESMQTKKLVKPLKELDYLNV